MPRDTQIVLSATTGAPKDYTLPGSVELVLRTVQATFTDNGAASDWLPCVELISDSGHTIARAVDPNVKVTAGGDAEVSFFPGSVEGTAAASSSGQGTLVAEQLVGTTQTITAGNQAAVSWDRIAADPSGVFSAGTGSGTTWHIEQTGLYLVTLQILPDPNWPTAAQGPILFRPDVPIDTINYSQFNDYTPGSTLPGSFGAVVSTYAGVPASWSATIQNQSSVTLTLIGGGPANNGTALSMNRLGPEVLLP